VSTGTVRKALEQMEAEFLITRRQGRGTFVNDPSSGVHSLRLARVHEPDGTRIWGEVKSAEIAAADASEAERQHLRLYEGDKVYRIKRLRMAHEQPFMYEEASVPLSLFPDLVSRGEVTYRILSIAQEYGLLIGRTKEQICVGAASATMAELLEVPEGAPIAVFDRVVQNAQGIPVEWRTGWCNLGSNHYLVDL